MKRNLLTALLMSLCLSVATGCGDSGMSGNDLPDGGGADAGPDMAPLYPDWNAQSPAICGQPAYTWQPAANVGAVLQISDPHFGTERAPVAEALVALSQQLAPELVLLSQGQLWEPQLGVG